jgi:hypothetical protein
MIALCTWRSPTFVHLMDPISFIDINRLTIEFSGASFVIVYNIVIVSVYVINKQNILTESSCRKYK